MRRDSFSIQPPADERVTRLLRALVAPPADGEYWDGLEERIMSRVRAERRERRAAGAGSPALWTTLWDALAPWARPVALAAGLALAAAALAFSRLHEQDVQMAYEAVVTPPTAQGGLPAQTASRGTGVGSAREATLRYLMTY